MEFVKLFSLKLTSKMPISPGREGGGGGTLGLFGWGHWDPGTLSLYQS